jgi:4-aminobutyrate aminotransferase-like enzyme
MKPFGEQLPDVRVPPPGPRSLELAVRLRGVESRNVTHLARDFPVFWDEARGANVRDADGNVYVDLTGAFGVAVAGHANPRIGARIAAQAERLVHGMGDVHPPTVKVELLERLAALVPIADPRAVLASSGSEAVEIALKTGLLATGRPGILAFEGGYHGLTVGSLAAMGRDDFRHPFARRLYPGVRLVPFPGGGAAGAAGAAASTPGSADAARVLDAVAAALAEGAPAPGSAGAPDAGRDPIGTVIIEPIQGRAGVRVPPPGFLGELAVLVRDAGALLVFDEIFTGFGRTGSLFVCQEEGVVPDLLCVGKSLGGGLPLSACLGPKVVMDAWPESGGEALHTSTFLGHPLACAAALAFLDELEGAPRGDGSGDAPGETLPARARRLGDALLARLREELEGVPGVRDVRGRGLFIGIELAPGAGARVAVAALARGLLLLPAGGEGEVVELSPPLTIAEEQLDYAVRELVGVIRELSTA